MNVCSSRLTHGRPSGRVLGSRLHCHTQARTRRIVPSAGSTRSPSDGVFIPSSVVRVQKRTDTSSIVCAAASAIPAAGMGDSLETLVFSENVAD